MQRGFQTAGFDWGEVQAAVLQGVGGAAWIRPSGCYLTLPCSVVRLKVLT